MEKKLTHSKWFLYLTEFFAGMSVMAVELGASRLMAPYFSSSQIVWTVIIGVIMIAMAVGNIWGGRMADKSKSPDRLYGRVIIAAIWIALIPFAGRWMIAGISFLLATFVTKNFLVWAALAACLVIFAFPCVLLGTVTPSLTKFTVDNLDDTGRTVGQLNALNTIGSIIGTFVPTFLTIPAVGTAATFLIFAGVLAAIGIVYFTFERKKTVTGIIAVVLVAGLCFACAFAAAFLLRWTGRVPRLAGGLCAAAAFASLLLQPGGMLPLLAVLIAELADRSAGRYMYGLTAAALVLLVLLFPPDSVRAAVASALLVPLLFARWYVERLSAARAALERSREEIDGLTGRLRDDRRLMKTLQYTARLEERNRLAARIHDKIGHGVSGSVLLLEAALLQLDSAPEKARKSVETAASSHAGEAWVEPGTR